MTTTRVPIDRFPPALLEVVRTLEEKGHRAWVVGGCLRDLLLGRPASDWDLATSARPEAVVAAFKRTIPTGIKHGTVTVIVRGISFEVTTLRGEGAYSDGRRPDSVAFVDDIEADLARRDFTVNAIAYDPVTGDFVDPFGGERDLEAKVLRAVGDPLARFGEDGLRILRGARFTATLGFTLDPETEAAFAPCLPVYQRVSHERVREEWLKAMKADAPSSAFAIMRRTGILGVSCPALRALDADVFARDLAVVDAAPKDAFVRHAALFAHVDAATVEAWLAAYRYANDEQRTIGHLVRQRVAPLPALADDVGRRRVLARVGRPNAARFLALLVADANAHGDPFASAMAAALEADLASGVALAVRDLALRGEDLLGLGRGPGKWIGQTLDALLELVVREPALNERDVLLDRARAMLEGA